MVRFGKYMVIALMASSRDIQFYGHGKTALSRDIISWKILLRCIISKMYRSRPSRMSLNDEITDIYESNKQTDNEKTKKEEWREDLESSIQRQFPNLRLVLAGSTTSGFATRGSDCDFALIRKSSLNSSCRSGLSVLRDVETILKSGDKRNSLVTEVNNSASSLIAQQSLL